MLKITGVRGTYPPAAFIAAGLARGRSPLRCLAALIAAGLWIWASPAAALWGIGGSSQKKIDAKSEANTNAATLPGMNETAPAPAPQSSTSEGLPGFNSPAVTQAPKADSKGPTEKNTQPAAAASGSNLPSEVVIKGSGEGAQKLGSRKPPLNIEIDPFESVRDSLNTDSALLLADSPYTVSWRHTYPDILHSPRVVQPWHTVFSERPGIVFNIQKELQDTIGRPLDSREVRNFQWSLTIADEEGRVFQRYDGQKDPPEELVWTGQNDQGEWIKAGRSYSAVYQFTDPNGSPHTKVGRPVQFTGMMHQESDGLHISLDSAVLFGSGKTNQDIGKSGYDLLRSAADLIKRRFNAVPVQVRIYSSTKDLADVQANVVAQYISGELMTPMQNIGTDSNHAAFSDQRVELVLLNR